MTYLCKRRRVVDNGWCPACKTANVLDLTGMYVHEAIKSVYVSCIPDRVDAVFSHADCPAKPKPGFIVRLRDGEIQRLCDRYGYQREGFNVTGVR